MRNWHTCCCSGNLGGKLLHFSLNTTWQGVCRTKARQLRMKAENHLETAAQLTKCVIGKRLLHPVVIKRSDAPQKLISWEKGSVHC